MTESGQVLRRRNHQRRLAHAAGVWDRQRQDVKEVIEQVSQIVDPKQVPWTIRVGQCVGRAAPKGQLAEFLGPDLIVCLWGARIAHA